MVGVNFYGITETKCLTSLQDNLATMNQVLDLSKTLP